MKRVLLLLALAACGPVSPQQAAERCEQRARAAQGPTGEIYVGVGTGGPGFGGEVILSTDYLRGRDPLMVYDQCVRELSGQGPIRPPDLTP